MGGSVCGSSIETQNVEIPRNLKILLSRTFLFTNEEIKPWRLCPPKIRQRKCGR